ncbi:MAG: NAD(P)-dependent oxidoreductase [Acidimicrobiia bacterium]|nr:NAD(P)-dependent oxidoreductase [Acidimicrobiia bacterium]
MKERIGVVGIGVMGSAMSGHLLEAGYEVNGFDVVPERVEAFAERGGIPHPSGAAVARASDVVLLSLPSVASLDAATEDVAGGAHDDLIVVEMGVFPMDAKERSRDHFAEFGVELMDVPVSGTGLQAADATLVVFASGSSEAFERTAPIFSVIGRSTHYLGKFGNGSIMKYIANLLVAVHNLSTAEAHALGIAAGMDPALVQKVMSDGVGSSKIFDIRGPMMVADRYDPPSARLSIILKDARIIKGFAEGVGAPTPLLDAAIPVYEQSEEEALGDLDAAALCRHLEWLAGLQRATEGPY